MKEEKLFLLGGDLRGHGPWTPGRNQRLQRFFFSPPSSAPPFLLAGFVSCLGRRRSWVGRLHGPTRRRAQVSPCVLLLRGGLVFRGGFSLDADACVRQRLYDSLAIDASDAGVSRPSGEIVVGFGESFESDGGRRGWDENRGEEEHGVGRMDRRWRREDDGGSYPAPGDGGDLDRGRKLRRYRGSRRFGAGEVPYDLVGSGWREDWETGGIGGGNWLGGWRILSGPSGAEWAERSGAGRGKL